MPSDDDELIAWLRRVGLAQAKEAPRLVPLTGGVSSDVFRVDLRSGPICLKRAVAQLRVSSDWRAPLARSNYEVAWLRTVRTFGEALVPEVLAHDPEANRFAMTWFPPDQYRLWKRDLAVGQVSQEFAGQVGRALAMIHGRTAGARDVEANFATDDLFAALRIEPFLRHTAQAHPDLGARLEDIASTTLAHKIALVHGDVSPKNLLCGPTGPVFLDAECAWFGDPAFDIAFCCTHLLLKALWRRAYSAAVLAALAELRDSYLCAVVWEERSALDARAAALVAALLLARIDGKSPVDYLGDCERSFARETALELLAARGLTLTGVAATWRDKLQNL